MGSSIVTIFKDSQRFLAIQNRRIEVFSDCGYGGDGGGGKDILEPTLTAFDGNIPPQFVNIDIDFLFVFWARWDKEITITNETESLFLISVQDMIFFDTKYRTDVYFSILKFLRTSPAECQGI